MTSSQAPLSGGVYRALEGRWHRGGVLTYHGLSLAAQQPGAHHHLALGGGGIGNLIIHLFIWHEIFRLIGFLWRIPTFGPFVVVLLGLLLVGLVVWRQARGPIRSGNGPIRWGRRRSSPSTGYGSGSGPRDW
jgi:hypothetical protein